jgi:formylglycine-generating enzyme required for sulfatase activity
VKIFSLVLAALLPLGCKRVEREVQPDAGRVESTEGGVEMVLIPGGSFQMGSNAEDQIDELPHTVYVDSFHMDKYEVTQEEYERVTGTNPSRWKGEANPVEQIRWKDAIEYCNARSRLEGLQPAYDEQSWQCNFEASGYRLPTEADWEYAARAGTSTAYWFGSDGFQLGRHAWFTENGTRGPHPVGQKEPNPWGLYDLYGNVWEWCHDHYQEDYYQESPEENPRGPRSGKTRVVRGGCWNSRPDMCRSSYRNYEDPAFTDNCFAKEVHGFVGIRCVRGDR